MRIFLLSIFLCIVSFLGGQVFPYMNASTGNEGQYIVDADTNIYMYHGSQIEKLDKNFNVIWVNNYNGLNFYSLLLSKTGSLYYIAKDSGPSSYANIIGKLNSDGSSNWCKQFQTSYSQNGEYFCQVLLDRNHHLAISGSDNYMTGTITKKPWFLKLDTLGNMISSKTIEISGLTFDKIVIMEDSAGIYRFIGDYSAFETGGLMSFKFDEATDSVIKTGFSGTIGQHQSITLKKIFRSKYDPAVYFSIHYVLNWVGLPYGSVIRYRNDSVTNISNFTLPMGPHNIDNFDEDEFGNILYTVSGSYANSHTFENWVYKIDGDFSNIQTVQYFNGFMFWPPNYTSDITGKVHALYGNKYFHDLYGSNFLSNPLHVTELDSNLNATCTTANTYTIPNSISGAYMTSNTMPYEVTIDASISGDLFPTATAVTNFSINANFCMTVGTNQHTYKSTNLSIQPNPAVNIIHVITPDNENITSGFVFDVSGNQVATLDQDKNFLDVTAFSAGMYFLKIKTVNGETCIKFIKE